MIPTSAKIKVVTKNPISIFLFDLREKPSSYKEKWELELDLGFNKAKIKLRNEPNTRSHRDGDTKTLLGCRENVQIEKKEKQDFSFGFFETSLVVLSEA
jgi:hypothetical protein